MSKSCTMGGISEEMFTSVREILCELNISRKL
jgi:hypothetical protein